MKPLNYKKQLLIIHLSIFTLSCEEMVELDPPSNQLIREEVFNNEATVKSAMTGIYNELFQLDFSNGYRSSVTTLAGLSADNISNISTTNLSRMEFEQNEVNPDNPDNLNIWSSAYNMIYITNSFLEGINNSQVLDQDFKKQMDGQARFVRAFTYFYLVNLYGDVPLILSTDYRENQLAFRTPKNEIYDQILLDLQQAEEELSSDYVTGERTQVNKFTVKALMARFYLYTENWSKAEELSGHLIAENATYKLQDDLNEVFLANSKEAIWQISPIGGNGISTQTNEGNFFIIDPIFSFFAAIRLQEDFVEQFDTEDLRLLNWIGYNESKNAHFIYKYKIWNSTEYPIREYSMVLRLAEQYLIRAEARAMQNNIAGAISDLDIIRQRAGLNLLADLNPTIEQAELLDEIFLQRRKELFAEWGHRWLDLKRSDRTSEALEDENPLWEDTDLLYPIPETERIKNPNLTQNEGY